MFRIYVVVLFLASICFSQKVEQLAGGENIVQRAQNVAGISLPITSVKIKLHKLTQIKLDESISTKAYRNEMNVEVQEEIILLPPDRIRTISTAKMNSTGFTDTTTTIWNDKKFKQISEYDVNGERRVRDTTAGVALDGLSQLTSKANLKKITVKPIDTQITFSNDLWKTVFLLILVHPIESHPKYEFIGQVNADNQIANVVQVNTAAGHILRLFFDEKTGNLLLMTEKFREYENDYEIKYYLSNREKWSGVSIPTKMKIEYKAVIQGQSPVTFYEYLDIEQFEIKPKVNEKIFEIK